MFIHKTIISVNTNQIAFAVGKNKDSYYLLSYFYQNVETNELSSRHEVVKNGSYPEKDPRINYPEDKKFKEVLFQGTAKKCQQYIKDIVDFELEWTYDKMMNMVHPLHS